MCKWATSDVAWILSDNKLVRMVRARRQRRRQAGRARGAVTRSSTAARRTRRTTRRPRARSAIRWCGPTSSPTSTDPERCTVRRARSYLGTVGDAEDDDVDTLWWFDGTDTWQPTAAARRGIGTGDGDPLRPGEPRASCTSGTTVGVWRGQRDLTDQPDVGLATARQRAARGGGGGPRPVRQRRAAPVAGGDRLPRRVGAATSAPTSSTSPTCVPTTTTSATASGRSPRSATE